MNYHYKIGIVDEKEKWIFISHDEWDEIDAFVNLVKDIQNECNGKIIEVGDTQYKVEGSLFNLIYQWDSCFGSVVIYNRNEQKEPAIEFLQGHFNKLNV
jgi:hypothetical protein